MRKRTVSCYRSNPSEVIVRLMLLIILFVPISAEARRRACLEACTERIAACAQTCDEFADLARACRNAIMKACLRNGAAACETPTTTTTSTTTTTLSSACPTHDSICSCATAGLCLDEVVGGLPNGGFVCADLTVSLAGTCQNSSDCPPGMGCIDSVGAHHCAVICR
jgi:hypothetical protein